MSDTLLKTWEQFSKKIGGTFKQEKDTNYFHSYEAYTITYPYEKKILISVYLQLIPERGRGTFLTHYTRVNIPFTNLNNIELKLSTRNAISKLFKIFNSSIVITNNKAFNKAFQLKVKNSDKLLLLFNQNSIQQIIIGFKDLYIAVIHHKDFNSFPIANNEDVLEVNINYVLNNEADITKLLKLSIDLLNAII